MTTPTADALFFFVMILLYAGCLLLGAYQLFARKIQTPVWTMVSGNLPIPPGKEFLRIETVESNPGEFFWQLREAKGDYGFVPVGLALTLNEEFLQLPQVARFLLNAGEDPHLFLKKHEEGSFFPWKLSEQIVNVLLNKGIRSTRLSKFEATFACRSIDFTYSFETGRIISEDLRRKGVR